MLSQMWRTIGDMDTDTKLGLSDLCAPREICVFTYPIKCYRIDPCDPSAPRVPIPIEPSPPTDPPMDLDLAH